MGWWMGRGAGVVESHGEGDGAFEELIEEDGRGRRVGTLWGGDDTRVVHHNSKGGILDGEGDKAVGDVCVCVVV